MNKIMSTSRYVRFATECACMYRVCMLTGVSIYVSVCLYEILYR